MAGTDIAALVAARAARRSAIDGAGASVASDGVRGITARRARLVRGRKAAATDAGAATDLAATRAAAATRVNAQRHG
jgi:hypothetical protein